MRQNPRFRKTVPFAALVLAAAVMGYGIGTRFRSTSGRDRLARMGIHAPSLSLPQRAPASISPNHSAPSASVPPGSASGIGSIPPGAQLPHTAANAAHDRLSRLFPQTPEGKALLRLIAPVAPVAPANAGLEGGANSGFGHEQIPQIQEARRVLNAHADENIDLIMGAFQRMSPEDERARQVLIQTATYLDAASPEKRWKLLSGEISRPMRLQASLGDGSDKQSYFTPLVALESLCRLASEQGMAEKAQQLAEDAIRNHPDKNAKIDLYGTFEMFFPDRAQALRSKLDLKLN